jgi:hypothetical protein
MFSFFRNYEQIKYREYLLPLNSVPCFHIFYENIQIKICKTVLYCIDVKPGLSPYRKNRVLRRISEPQGGSNRMEKTA